MQPSQITTSNFAIQNCLYYKYMYISKLVSYKHWQIFLLTIMLPITLQSIGVSGITKYGSTSLWSLVYIIGLGLFGWTFFVWCYTVGTSLHKHLPAHTSLNITVFKAAIYTPLILIGILLIINNLPIESTISTIILKAIILSITAILNIFMLLSIIYILYYIPKALKSIELGRNASISEYFPYTLMLLFFIVGIWLIQPRINKTAGQLSEKS